MIDSHIHLWDLTRRPVPWLDPVRQAAIDRSFLPGDYLAEADRAVVGEAIIVQALNLPAETADCLAYAAAEPRLLGVVGWVDLRSPHWRDDLARFRAGPGGAKLVGIRHQAQEEADPAAWFADPLVAAGVRGLGELGLPFDVMARANQLPVVERLIAGAEGTVCVLNHAGKPPISDGWDSPGMQSWRDALTRIARLPNARIKLSGLTTLAGPGWTPVDLAPVVEFLLLRFGADRVIWGTDWPVSATAADYPATVAALRDLTAGLHLAERDAVFSGNARQLYLSAQLPRPSSE